jgi:coenzyme F420-reducing hydrogenase delta subunit
VRRAYETLKQYSRVHVDIVAFNDPEGGYAINRTLAEKRMRAVRDSMAALGIDKERLHLVDFDPDILSSDSRFTEFRDRRGIMMFARYSN